MKKNENEEQTITQTMKINALEQSNKALCEKLKLLRIQLESQSQLQMTTFNHSRYAASHKSHSDLQNSRIFHSTGGLKVEDSAKPTPGKYYEAVIRQLNALQEELQNIKEQHNSHMRELEAQVERNRDLASPTKLKSELRENVELIKLKRLSKKQTAQITSLQAQIEITNGEMKELQNNAASYKNEKENLYKELSNEKCRTTELASQISSLTEKCKLMEERVNDLQVEKATLQKYNENLLKLSLKKKSETQSSENKTQFTEQLKELEESLRLEIIAKSELEAVNSKLKYEANKNMAALAEVQAVSSSQKNEIKKLKEKLADYDLRANQKVKSSTMTDKSVTTTEERRPLVPIIQNEEYCATTVDEKPKEKLDSNIDLQLHKISTELNQCKELLRVECTLNNKYKKEIEELRMVLQKNDKHTGDNWRTVQNIFRNQLDRLKEILETRSIDLPKHVVDDLSKNISTRAFGNYQEYANNTSKLLDGCISLLENEFSKLDASRSSTKRKDHIADVDETVQTEISLAERAISVGDIESDDYLTSSLSLTQDSSQVVNYVVFELGIEKANFDHFSDHLMKSSNNDPKIFLTWNFLDNTTHQAYTPTISVTEGLFNCSCQYEGPWSQFLCEYLEKHGIRVEIHLVQDDISVRIAETRIDTSSALRHANENRHFISSFQNDNVKGHVTGYFVLKPNFAILPSSIDYETKPS